MKISILTPSFNSVKYIERAIQSTLKQDYKNWEHIILDGGSDDGTTELLKKYKHLVWESAKDKGQSDAMNKAFEKATGDIIIYLNVDDELEDGLLSTIVGQFSSATNVDMVVTNVRMNNQGTVSIRKSATSLYKILRFWPPRFPLNPVGYAYRRALQQRIGPFPIENHFSMDYWFLLRAYLFGNIVKHESIGGTYHIDGNNKSMDTDRSKVQLKAVRNEFIKRYFYRPAVLFFVVTAPFFATLSLIRKGLKKSRK